MIVVDLRVVIWDVLDRDAKLCVSAGSLLPRGVWNPEGIWDLIPEGIWNLIPEQGIWNLIPERFWNLSIPK